MAKKMNHIPISSRMRFLHFAAGILIVGVLIACATFTTLATQVVGTIAAPSSTNVAATSARATDTTPPSDSPAPSQIPNSTDTSTPAPTPTLEVIRFAVIGDYGAGGVAERDVANLIKSWAVDFIITTGDNNYPNGEAATIDQNIGQFYHEYIHPYHGKYGEGADKLRFFPTLGNHDWTFDGAKPYLDYFVLPGNERYYDFIWGPVHFFALDADSREPDGVHANSVQAMWLKERLTASTSPWKVVYMHQPPYSSGLHGSVTWMRWPFVQWGASAVLAGHDHSYERLDIESVPFIVNGLGGGARYRFGEILPQSQVRFNEDWGAMLVVADALQMTFQFITRQGVVVDTYQIRH